MRILKFQLCLLGTLIFPFLLQGKDIYVAQTAAGSGTGIDSSDSLPSSWFSDPKNWGGGTNQINAGDVVHLVGMFTNGIIAQGGGAPGNRVTILFEPNANFTMTAGSAIVLGANNYITIDGGQNGLIQNTSNGTALSQQIPVNGISGTPSIGEITVQNLTMTNLFVHQPGATDSVEYGCGINIYGACANIDVHGCTIAQSERGILLDYATGSSANWNIYSNTILNCSWGVAIGSGNNNAILNGINISGNRITGQSTWDTANNYYHEDGIYLYAEHPGAAITNVTIAGNTLGPDDGNNATSAIFLSAEASGSVGIWNVAIYNNVVFSKTSYLHDAFMCFFNNINNIKIVNNTLDSGVSGSGWLYILTCSNLTICNNIYSDGQDAVLISYTGLLWWNPVCEGQIKKMDYNDYFNLTGGSAGFGGNGGGPFSTWVSAGFDVHSAQISPRYFSVETGDFHLLSPNNVGTNLTGLGISGLSVDKDGVKRPATGTTWDAGAYQFTGSVTNRPSPPTNLRILSTH